MRAAMDCRAPGRRQVASQWTPLPLSTAPMTATMHRACRRRPQHPDLGRRSPFRPKALPRASTADGEAALKALLDNPPDLAVFDIKMPRNGRARAAAPHCARKASLPVIFLTSKDDELDEALGLAMGADDYIAKPFSQRLLDRAHPRHLAPRRPDPRGWRAGAPNPILPNRFVRGRLVMDPARHEVLWDGKAVTLTVTEFLILEIAGSSARAWSRAATS